jgi:hypothetical protein
MTDEMLDEMVEPIDEPGVTSWACSEEGGGPDVGIWVGLGGGEFLWCGEIVRERYDDAAPASHDLGSDGGWWLIHYTKTDAVVLAKMLDAEASDHLTQLMARLLYNRPTPTETQDV